MACAPANGQLPDAHSVSEQTAAAVPLFRDPIHDGAADPVVVWNRARKTWWMFYTNRRADLDDNNGVTWVHGTRIGIAESCDGGASWNYLAEADIPVPAPDYTLWAPEIIDTGGMYHMFLTVVPGTFTDWNHPRHILHLTSKDLLHWKPLANANLESDRTIDACIFRLPTGLWRLWYKNEADSSKVYFSDSPDLVHWTPKGIATANHGEGPVVFQWRGSYWLINDPHAGLAVFRSSDLTTWQQQPQNLLREPGTQPTDRAMGNHADVVVDGSGRAWLFYFTQQGGADAQGHPPGWARRSVMHVTELHVANGILTVDRNAPATIHMLPPPANKKSDVAKAWTMTAENGAPSAPVRVSSETLAGLAIYQPMPIYRAPVKAEHVSGAIILHAIISKQGDVENLSVISCPPLLASAALEAVKKWKYKPYRVNGEPVEVETTININILFGAN
ncbi:MAG: TonB family protein [Acidobacteriaceae bacterium]